jgi:hypothetical protein
MAILGMEQDRQVDNVVTTAFKQNELFWKLEIALLF